MNSLIFQIYIGDSALSTEIARIKNQASNAGISMERINNSTTFQCSHKHFTFLCSISTSKSLGLQIIIQPSDPLKIKTDPDGQNGINLAFYVQCGLKMIKGYEIINLTTSDLERCLTALAP